MPFAFIFAGTVFLVSGARGTSSDLVTLLKGDLSGSHNFFYWILAILLIGSLGYIKNFEGLSRAFLVLVLVVLVLADDKQTNAGFFKKFQQSIAEITK